MMTRGVILFSPRRRIHNINIMSYSDEELKRAEAESFELHRSLAAKQLAEEIDKKILDDLRLEIEHLSKDPKSSYSPTLFPRDKRLNEIKVSTKNVAGLIPFQPMSAPVSPFFDYKFESNEPETQAVDISRFPHSCPICSSPAYIGLSLVECSKEGCK